MALVIVVVWIAGAVLSVIFVRGGTHPRPWWELTGDEIEQLDEISEPDPTLSLPEEAGPDSDPDATP